MPELLVIFFLILMVIAGCAIAGFAEAQKDQRATAADGQPATESEKAFLRAVTELDWGASGLEGLTYGEGRPRVTRREVTPAGIEVEIALPTGVSSDHLTDDVLARLGGLLPGRERLSVVRSDRRSVTLRYESRDPLGGQASRGPSWEQ